MNLSAFLQRGAAHAPSDAQRQRAAVVKAAEETRAKWLNALLVDQTRAWMSVGESDIEVIHGLATMLTIAGFASVHDTRSVDTPDLRVIRGAISAATQCAAAGGVVSVADAHAFSSAATRAESILRTASVDAIVHAATEIRNAVGL